jgi:hypothetical protein
MIKKHFLLLCILSIPLFAQNTSFTIPLNIQKTFSNNTRSFSGKTGAAYWQNRADYEIKAELDPSSNKLSGEETIYYYNNSPDTLMQLVIKLLPDLYRKGNMRDFEISPNALHDGVLIKSIFYNDEQVKRNNKKNALRREGTNLFLTLTNGLLPKGNAELKISWSYTIPGESQIRTGEYDSTSFFVAYWFPQVAVYDDIDGWDVNNYTGFTETYNDFGNYDVHITVPKNFVVWATGTLTNPEEVFAPKIIERYKNAMESSEVVKIITQADLSSGSVTQDQSRLVYKFKAEYVPDFAFGTSDHYLWDGSSLIEDRQKNRKVFIDAAYNPKSKDFYSVAKIAREAINYFSNQMPGIPYPYPEMTIFNGQGGMEFPMMVNDSSIENDLPSTYGLTAHEICHTYFPFYMGTNERKYAWMDEGWAVSLPMDFQKQHGQNRREDNTKQYNEYAGNELDVPPVVPSSQLKSPSYRTASYRRPGAAYDILRNMMGDELFKKCLHEFIYRWNGKHPMPYDFFFTFNEVYGEDLSWFWNPWFFENKYPDLSININRMNDENKVTINNIGGIPVPVVVKFVYENKSVETVINRSADIWKDGKTKFSQVINSTGKVVKIELGDKWIPDTNPQNNFVDMKSK